MNKILNDAMYDPKKYVVVPRKYLLSALNGGEWHEFDKLVDKINCNNQYIVVNLDEPYAQEVWDTIQRYEKKEIVAFMGRAGSGKDYQCNLLKEKGFHKMAFADALRNIAFTCLGINPEWGMKHYDELKQTNIITLQDIGNTDEPTEAVTFRDVLEKLGTQGIRHYDNDFWCKCLLKDLRDSNYKKVCISDLRFPNEFKALHEFAYENGYEFTCYICDYRSSRYQKDNNHESAWMSNYFASRRNDMDVIYLSDIEEYEEYMRN